VATIVAGQRPADFTAEEAAAHDLAAALMRGGGVPDATWAVACDSLGEEGSAEIVFLVGSYSILSAVLNGFDVPVPE
jgi:4-carboxymuconolactone decarboxylase